MASAKIHINLSLGLIEAEGDEAFVRAVYDDFKGRLEPVENGQNGDQDRDPVQNGTKGGNPAKARRSASRKAAGNGKAKGGADTPGMTQHTPKRDNALDLAKLKGFLAEYDPQNNPDRYVLYIQFLKDELGKDPCTADQLFSCLLHMKDKIPKAFGQNLVDTRNKYGYIAFTGPNDITLTTTGLNRFNLDMPKKAPK